MNGFRLHPSLFDGDDSRIGAVDRSAWRIVDGRLVAAIPDHMNGLIDRSSFGEADTAAARETVSDEKARDLVERPKRVGQEHQNGSTL